MRDFHHDVKRLVLLVSVLFCILLILFYDDQIINVLYIVVIMTSQMRKIDKFDVFVARFLFSFSYKKQLNLLHYIHGCGACVKRHNSDWSLFIDCIELHNQKSLDICQYIFFDVQCSFFCGWCYFITISFISCWECEKQVFMFHI